MVLWNSYVLRDLMRDRLEKELNVESGNRLGTPKRRDEMADNRKSGLDDLTPEERERIEQLRLERRRKMKKRRKAKRNATLVGLLVVLLVCVVGVGLLVGRSVKLRAEKKAQREAEIQAEEEKNQERQNLITEAENAAKTYDYDKAVELLESIDNYDKDAELVAKIASYETEKSSLVDVGSSQITHIFYHSLVVDPDKAFAGNDSVAAGFKQWMTTTYEFDQITEKMYEAGYVLINLHDLVDQTTDEDGTVHFTQAKILLPEGKTPYVLSLDDLSYYHTYDGRGIATKMVVGDDGKPTCEYTEDDGTVVTGDYDCVPRLDAFLEEHPDATYHNARGTIALTGYNGILGYRTDIAYKTKENLSEDQQEYLNNNPDFDWDQECEEAKKVADCIKEDGWDFASHTWGHIRVGDASLESIKTDTEKWMEYVSPLIGGTDTIIFAHGQDLADWHDYSTDNEKYAYLKSQGFNFYCNVDSSQYFLQIRDGYVRQGRRNLDGYRLWNDAKGNTNYTSDLFDAAEVLDPARTDMPDL